MLAKNNRLSKRQFEEYFKTGKRHHFPLCTVVYVPHQSLHASVVVGKKVAKRAVQRNTLRRKVYAVLYDVLKRTGQNGVFIIVLKPAICSVPRRVANTEIRQTIAAVLKKT